MLFNPLNKKYMNKKCFLLMLFMLWSSKTEFRFSDQHDPGTDLSFLLWGFLISTSQTNNTVRLHGNWLWDQNWGEWGAGKSGFAILSESNERGPFQNTNCFWISRGSAFLTPILFTRWRLWRTRQSLYRNAIARVPNPLPSYVTSFMCLSCEVLSLLTNYS